MALPNTPGSSDIIENLTAMEMSIAERTSKLSIATLDDPEYPKVDLLGALGWVYAKRSEPTLTFKDYMSTRTLTQITDELGIQDDEDELPGDPESGKAERPSTS